MKKNLIYIICGVVVVALLAAMLIFIFSGDDSSSQGENAAVNFEGTWEVAAVVQNETPTFVDKEFMVFTADKAESFKDGKTEAFASSAYEISANKLVLPDISREYIIDKKSDNIIRLYETTDKYLLLIKYPNSDMTDVEIKEDAIIGKWNVKYKSAYDQQYVKEELVFTSDKLELYREGSSEPAVSAPYVWQDGIYIFAEALGTNFEYHFISENKMIFIDTKSMAVWELDRIA